MRHYLDTGERLDGLTAKWKLEVLRRQAEESVRTNPKGELSGLLHIRRHLAASPIFKGIHDFRPTRIRMLRAETLDELNDIFREIEPLLS